MEEEKKSVLLSVGERRTGRPQILRKKSEEELFSQMLTPISSEAKKRGQAKKEEVKSSKKDSLYLTKMMTPPLACMLLGERMPDRE